MKTIIKLTFILAFSLFSTQAFAQTYIGKQKDIDKILANIKLFSQYYMAADVDKLVACYTTDGKIFPGNREILGGKESLEKYWTTPDNVKILHHKVTPIEIKVIKDIAYDYGYYEGKTLTAEGKEVSWQGKYVIVWKKVGKEWKIYLDIWNRVP